MYGEEQRNDNAMGVVAWEPETRVLLGVSCGERGGETRERERRERMRERGSNSGSLGKRDF